MAIGTGVCREHVGVVGALQFAHDKECALRVAALYRHCAGVTAEAITQHLAVIGLVGLQGLRKSLWPGIVAGRTVGGGVDVSAGFALNRQCIRCGLIVPAIVARRASASYG